MDIRGMRRTLYCTCRVMRLCAARRDSSTVNWLDVTVYTGSHPLRHVCVPSDTLSNLPSVRNPHSQLLLLVVVGGNRSCGQGSIIPPHGAVGPTPGSTGGRSIPAGHLLDLCPGWWLFGIVSSSILQHCRCIPTVGVGFYPCHHIGCRYLRP